MKSISTALSNHLQQEVTTLTTCWEIKRRDGRFFRFTEHTSNLTIDGNLYNADIGYARTAIANSADMSVDNLDVEGFIDASGITNEDLEKGLFDYAEVKIFLVNYEDVSQGILKLKKGPLGEVQTDQADRFKAELRGLSQRLQQTLGSLTQATCRADLGDAQCKFPILVPVVLRDTAYNVGEFVRKSTGNPSRAVLDVPVISSDFEALSPWSIIEGDPEIVESYNTVSPFTGSNFLNGNTAGSPSGYTIRQDVDITSIPGFDQTDLDAGFYLFQASIRQIKSGSNSRDAGRIRVEALDENALILKELWNSRYQVLPTGSWKLLTVYDVLIPATTKTLRFIIEAGSYDASGITEVGFDNLQAEIVDNQQTGSQAFYENTIYECTTAGTTAVFEPSPDYDTTVDNTTTDGSAVFTAREAFMRHAVVSSVTSKRVFRVTIDTQAASVDDYFNLGGVIWETGNNSDISMEIKDWTESTSEVTLFLEMQNTIQVGDKLKMFPGCDFLRATCRDKFRIANSTDFADGNVRNMDAEPDLPGPDFVLTYPDAK